MQDKDSKHRGEPEKHGCAEDIHLYQGRIERRGHAIGMRLLCSKIYLLCYSAMLKILTYYAFNCAADSQLITSSTVMSIAPGLHYHKYYVHNAP